MSLLNYFNKVPKSNSSKTNSSAISIAHMSESEVWESANHEILILTSNSLDLDCTTSKNVSSTPADSCSACSTAASACASEEQSVTDLGSKIDGPKQPILEIYLSTHWKSPTKI